MSDNVNVYGRLKSMRTILQMSSPGFGWLDVMTGSEEDLKKVAQKRSEGIHHFRIIERVEVDRVLIPHTDFATQELQ